MSWRPEGIWQCRGCDTIYTEYVNGCPRHDGERKVVLMVAEHDMRGEAT